MVDTSIETRFCLDPSHDADVLAFVIWASKLRRTTVVTERLVQLGYGTYKDGEFVLRDDLRTLLGNAMTKVGLVLNTSSPVPVSSVIAARRFALVGFVKNA